MSTEVSRVRWQTLHTCRYRSGPYSSSQVRMHTWSFRNSSVRHAYAPVARAGALSAMSVNAKAICARWLPRYTRLHEPRWLDLTCRRNPFCSRSWDSCGDYRTLFGCAGNSFLRVSPLIKSKEGMNAWTVQSGGDGNTLLTRATSGRSSDICHIEKQTKLGNSVIYYTIVGYIRICHTIGWYTILYYNIMEHTLI